MSMARELDKELAGVLLNIWYLDKCSAYDCVEIARITTGRVLEKSLCFDFALGVYTQPKP
jgi:hypothetical protein